MAKKRVITTVKIQLPAGAATPAPPVGTALGPHGVSTPEFVKQYNAATESQRGQVIPVEITIFEDRSFNFILKTPPASDLIKKALNVDKGSGTSGKSSIGTLPRVKLREIAELKMKDLNAVDIEGAMLQIRVTARSMGIEVDA